MTHGYGTHINYGCRRVDAYYGSIECQKAGALHLHLLTWLQCLHQHTPLSEIAEMLTPKHREGDGNVKQDAYEVLTRLSAFKVNKP